MAQQPEAGCKRQLAASPVASPVPGAESAAHVSGQVTQSRVDSANQPVVWVAVDKQTFLPLQTEVRDAAGNVLQRTTVTQVEYNISIPQATFAYTPPAGVAVSTFHGGNGADVKRALATTPKSAEQPPAKIHP